MRVFIPVIATTILALSGCAAQYDPARQQQSVSFVNSLTWTNPMGGKPDGQRTLWPLHTLNGHTERFPLFQLKQCDAAGACRWGVVDARRTINSLRYVKGGVAFDIDLTLHIDRRHEPIPGSETIRIAIPADVAAIQSKRTHRDSIVLEYGKVKHIELDGGVGYDVCVQRLDSARKAVEECPIPHT